MNKTGASQLRRSVADNLKLLARILEETGIVKDAGSLLGAANQCLTDNPYGHFSWRYDLGVLNFDLSESEFKNVRPVDTEVLRLELSGAVCGKCLDDDAEDDPFHELTLNFVIKGRIKDGNTYKSLTCAWHLDRDENGGGVGEFCHPAYHFQSGGQRVWEVPSFDHGSHLLLESPRNAHHPLDAVLAVDYVAAHFLGVSKWKALREDPTYQRLLRDSAESFLKPYARSVAAAWSSISLNSTWDAKLLWPSLPQL